MADIVEDLYGQQGLSVDLRGGAGSASPQRGNLGPQFTLPAQSAGAPRAPRADKTASVRSEQREQDRNRALRDQTEQLRGINQALAGQMGDQVVHDALTKGTRLEGTSVDEMASIERGRQHAYDDLRRAHAEGHDIVGLLNGDGPATTPAAYRRPGSIGAVSSLGHLSEQFAGLNSESETF